MTHDSPKQAVRCVRLAIEDAPALSSLESRCFALPWTEQSFAEAFAGKTFRAFGIRETASPLPARELAGYIAVYHTPDEVEILNIAVREDRRRRGYGSLLIATALQDAKETGILRGVLEVRISNAPSICMNLSGSGRRASGAGIIKIPEKTRSFILWIWDRLGRIHKLRSWEYSMRTIIAANWKMNKTRTEAKATAHELASILGGAPDDRDVIVFAPFTALEAAKEGLDGAPGIFIGAQNMYPAESGAFTGEISPAMLREAGCTWVLTGHSERRHVLGESPDFVGKKTAFALEQGFSVILCIGETLAERKAGKLNSILWLQLERGLAGLGPNADYSRLAVAYEPVWAIGTGQTASDEDIRMVHTLIRELLSSLLGSNGIGIQILYGGSVKPDNAKAILSLDNVDGLLVGGASLQAQSFADIVRADLA